MRQQMKKPEPAKWMAWTVVFAILSAAASGSWWQCPALLFLAGSGGTWAVENAAWEKWKRR